MKRLYLALVVTVLLASRVHSADIAGDVGAGSGGFDNSDGGYLEVGLGLNLRANSDRLKASVGLLLAGAYRYQGLFFEAVNPGVNLASGKNSGLTLGFNIWRNNRWALDFLGASTQGSSALKGPEPDNLNSVDSERERAVLDRDYFYNGAGVRLTGYFGNSIFQYRLVSDVHGGNGTTGSARIGYSRPVKNWNFHGVLSANYTSKETGQYWYGISEEEASVRFPQYDIRSSSVTYSAEIGVTYPLRESIVLRSTAGYTRLADAVTSSPLLEQKGEFDTFWNTTISYVF